MRYAIIDDGKVVNVALADAALTPNWIESDTAQVGDLYVNGVFETPPPDYVAGWAAVRAERNTKLSACDWTQLPDAPVDSATWAVYRQALRDITTQSDPFNIVWPQEPSA